MIYEMRTYTVVAGELGAVVKNAGSVAREVRGDRFGKLEGYWQTDIGPLNTVMHLWSYESFDERNRLRDELANHKPWVDEYLPLVLPRLVRQEIRLMKAFLPFKAPETEGNVYEFRYYQTKPGMAKEWAKHFANVMPAREKYSKNVCAWNVEAGQNIAPEILNRGGEVFPVVIHQADFGPSTHLPFAPGLEKIVDGDPETAFSPAEHLIPLAREADACGYEAMGFSDHVVHPEVLKTPYPYTADGKPRWDSKAHWPDPWVMIVSAPVSARAA